MKYDIELELTPERVQASYSFRKAIKIAPVRIRPFSEEDVRIMGPSFLDLERRPQRVELGRYLCIGIQGERWTCGQGSMETRKAISEPDAEGFRLYVQRDPQPVQAALINEPFVLALPNGDRWTSQTGAITWNGKQGAELLMRVVDMTIFLQTYEWL